MSCKTSVTPAIAFVDLATFDELHAYLHGGAMAVTYFVRSVKKANWFSFVPIGLRHVSGTCNFGEEFSASVNRSGDYVLNVWLRVKIPRLGLPATVGGETDSEIRWTHNFMHALVKKVNLTFNELCVHEFDSCWFDFNHYLRTPASKRVGYDTMIGEVDDMIGFKTAKAGASISTSLGTGGFFNLPIPLFFTEDSGVSLPVAALPFNDIKINYCLRDWRDMIVTKGSADRSEILAAIRIATADSSNNITLGAEPKITQCETMAHYAVIHNDERVLMGKAPRDMHIHQVQSLQEQSFDATAAQNTYDLRFSHAVHLLAWGAKNVTVPGEHGNYALVDSSGSATDAVDLNNFDPVAQTMLIYENTARVDMGADYFSTVVPWYWCDAVPDVSGIHAYSYSLEAFGIDPKGSTGYSKLANVSICLSPSEAAADDATTNASLASVVGSGAGHFESARKYRMILRVRNHNIVRLSGGSLGLPVL